MSNIAMVQLKKKENCESTSKIISLFEYTNIIFPDYTYTTFYLIKENTESVLDRNSLQLRHH